MGEKYNFGQDDDYLLTNNKLGIDSVEQLERAEQYAFMVRALQIETGDYIIDSFSKEAFQALHYHLYDTLQRLD